MTFLEHSHIVGWDIGGAHLKVAGVAADRSITGVHQYATPLWRGLQTLDDQLAELASILNSHDVLHAVTMTGELVDLFNDRCTGVTSLLNLFCRHFSPEQTSIYAVDRGLVSVDAALRSPDTVASANWQATAALVARHVECGILVDAGSTTTDIIPFRRGRPCSTGSNDQGRMRSGELVYTGIIRTPVMAVVQRAPFAGQWQNIAAEMFSTMADVYRVTGQLDERFDLLDTADGRDKTIAASIARLARMLGAEPGDESGQEPWLQFAGHVAEQQLQLIEDSFLAVRARLGFQGQAVVVGAGCGSFIGAMLAGRHGHEFLPLSGILACPGVDAVNVCACAPAIAVAQLARAGITL